MDLEAADLSMKTGRSKPLMNIEAYVQPQPVESLYGTDESIDFSMKQQDLSENKPFAPPNVSSGLIVNTTVNKRKMKPPEAHHQSNINSCSTSSRIILQPTRLQPHRAARYTESYSTSAPPSPDAVVLSDDEGRHMNGHYNGYDSDSDCEMPLLPQLKELSTEEWQARERKILKLREDLRNEEMKLVLLKKLHQSQMMKENIAVPAAPSPTTAPKLPTPIGRTSVVPTNLTTTPLPNRHLAPSHKHLLQSHTLISSSGVRNHGVHASPKINSSVSSPVHHQSVIRSGMGHTPVTAPPNVVMGYPAAKTLQGLQTMPSVQNQLQVSAPSSTSPVPPVPQTPVQVPQTERIENQTPAQRQAAAKLALRKQLEKTLLQIPPPKPPPPEMHFIPNANNQEFICLLGLEKVVDLITNMDSDSIMPPKPFACIQCSTDFTPVWKWQDRNNSNRKGTSVICENCVTSNIKKALKAEHTNRLKTAFVKALQQEQEIEQRMAQAVPSPPAPTTPPSRTPSSTPTPVVSSEASSPPTSHSPLPASMPRIGGGGGSNSSPFLQHIPKLTAHQSLLQAQAQQLQHLAQAQGLPQPAHMLPFAPLLAPQYPYQVLGKNPVSTTDLQRQYLLDMIPPRSMPQSSLNWKA